MAEKKLTLTFKKELVDKPIVFHLIKDFNLTFNILSASITPEEEGKMQIELCGEDADQKKGIEFLRNSGVIVDAHGKEVDWLEEKCTQCGACITICPTEAMRIDRKTMKVSFDKDKCISCELCVKPCPPRAFEVRL